MINHDLQPKKFFFFSKMQQIIHSPNPIKTQIRKPNFLSFLGRSISFHSSLFAAIKDEEKEASLKLIQDLTKHPSFNQGYRRFSLHNLHKIEADEDGISICTIRQKISYQLI
ncbi:uncharacterized protein LOC131599833 [Vicia villosa]|uniref:uncharacterized protein LOC131599833 n=1 Tax=Vicia villosa TaxID=3911 RepID=UPI00273C8CCC|nr:uncharacterized protein LOC131599833 [Vicia villosa]